MIQYTTPTFILTLPETVDLSLADTIIFSLRQGCFAINKTVTADGQDVSVFLSQEETARLKPGMCAIQLNWTYADGTRACSNIVNVRVGANLLKEVIS